MPDHRSGVECAYHDGGVRALIRFMLFALMMLSACADGGDAARCDMSITRDLAFTGENAEDTITVRAFGPSCDKVIGLYDIRSEDGHPIWSWSAPLPRAFGDVFPADKPDQMHDFLERWAQPTLTTTQTAPDWQLLAPGQTTLDRLTYDDIRARNLPMLCHAAGTARETCVFWEPAAGGAGHFFDRDAEGTEP